jgi:hypothetical protein
VDEEGEVKLCAIGGKGDSVDILLFYFLTTHLIRKIDKAR